jgi:CheY-like chemotaxis protein
MHDPRTPRPLKVQTLSVLVLDPNSFSRGLISEILRNLNVTSITPARDADTAMPYLAERPIDVVLVSWEEADPLNGLAFIRRVRQLEDNRQRQIPIILVTAGLTRQLVLAGRDAGADEFLAKPISPAALQQRLQMVIETPRPFIDCAVFLGPCRRRKNPADYYGEKRRAGERGDDAPTPMVDQDEIARETPMRRLLTRLRDIAYALDTERPETLSAALEELKTAKAIAVEQQDHALHAGIASFESYILVSYPQGQIDREVTENALGAIEQLATLPQSFTEARSSVAIALGKAIQQRLAA